MPTACALSTIGAARIALRDKGPAIVADTSRTVRFGGRDSAVIAAGAVLFSDPVELSVPPLADLAVSFHLPGEVPANFAITGRYARQTNYISPPGNFAADRVMPVGNLTDQWFFLCGVDVLAVGRGGRRRGARGLADRRQHLDDRRLLPLARPTGPPPHRPRRAADRRRSTMGSAATGSCTTSAATAASDASTVTCWRSLA